MPAPEVDVLVRGAGPAGCAAAAALRDAGLSVAVAQSGMPPPGFRPIALSHASRLILERIGAWEPLAATPIVAIEVSQAGGFGRTRFDAADAGVPALGYVVDYAALCRSLRVRVESLIAPEPVAARCVVHAEGIADAREKRYGQDALVALVATAPEAAGTAFERFTAEGPLALLPFAGRFAVVWALPPVRARALAACAGQEFLAALSAAAGRRVGRALAVEARAVQPIVLRVRRCRVAAREIYVGNAAQTLHPVAGQGLNVALRDAWELAQALCGAPDPGDGALLARYAASRRLDAGAAVRVTDMLARGFLGSSRIARAARGAALTALDVLPGPRRFFARRMIFGPSALP
ncbi:MAG TPA: FAD-dependent monooxygenase [Burkholderiales bacterium]|nr:FAD-dependent monooxygenase [Burkholderiales bacterium]